MNAVAPMIMTTPLATQTSIQAPILEMRGISQIFPGVKALDQVSISLYPGRSRR